VHRLARLVLTGVLLALVAGCGGDDGDVAAPGTEAEASVPFDQAFIDAMVRHHQEAIEMAEAAKERGLTQPDLQRVADDIIASQQREIDRMLDWREEWFGSRELGPVLPEVLGVPEGALGMEHGSADEVAGAADVDAAFAAMMIPHHDGAVAMAEAALERAEHEELRRLAAEIIDAQEREIEIMREHAEGVHHGG
jgi:uncharacterized protein (DUF305 family)